MLSRFTHKLAAYLVHVFTASGAVLGLLSINAIYQQRYVAAIWLMGMSILIDAIDGTFARLLKVKKELPKIDGALLDNLVDYFTYVVVPACFFLTSQLLPEHTRQLSACLVLLASAYQFCQVDAKTSDHFFKGFPSYWNIVVFYLFFWQISPIWNLLIIFVLILLVFVPIKYVYPSRMEYLTDNAYLRLGMLIATILWGLATFGLLWLYPNTNTVLVFISTAYLFLYGGVSLYRTFFVTPKVTKNFIVGE